MPKNGRFSYSGGSFDVYVIGFSYSWALDTKATSQARQRQTVYPFRAKQSDLNVTLQFRDVDEYRRFGEFARAYHMLVTSLSGRVGDAVPAMYFTSDTIPHQTMYGSGREDVGGIRYAVALPSIPMTFSNESVAPTVRLTLNILMDESGDLALAGQSASQVQGSLHDMVRSAEVKSFGDAAYGAASSLVGSATSSAPDIVKSARVGS